MAMMTGVMLMKSRKNRILFLLGALGYGAVELLWRGRTHWSMLLAGGLCLLLFSRIEERFSRQPLLYRVVLCALTVTGVELLFGLVFNLLLGMKVWDYSGVPLNFLGQICLPYTTLWGFLALPALVLVSYLGRKLDACT